MDPLLHKQRDISPECSTGPSAEHSPTLFPQTCPFCEKQHGRFHAPYKALKGPDDATAVPKCFLCFLLIHRKVGHSSTFASDRTQMFLLRSGRPERGLKGLVEGRQEVARFSLQKIPLAIFSPFCFMRGSVELATFLVLIGRARPRFFSTKS